MKLGHVGVVVAARTSSTRLPGKALLPLQGVPMLSFLLRRLRSVQSAAVVLATTELPVDDALATLARQEGVAVFRGSESDLIDRYVRAAAQFGLDTVARVTADCPFVDAELVDWCIRRATEMDQFDLATTKGQFPVGLDVEIYRAETMAALHATASLTSAHREHLTLYFYDQRENFVVRPIDAPPSWLGALRSFTVDTAGDYDYACSLADRFEQPEFEIASLLAAARSGETASRAERSA